MLSTQSNLLPRVNQTFVSADYQRYAALLSPFCAANGLTLSGLANGGFRPPDQTAPRPSVTEYTGTSSGPVTADTFFLIYDTGLPFNNPYPNTSGYETTRRGNYIMNFLQNPTQYATAPTFPGLTRVAHTVSSYGLLEQCSHCV